MNRSQAIRLALECMRAEARKKRYAYQMYQQGFADQQLQAERYIKLCEAMDALREMRNVALDQDGPGRAHVLKVARWLGPMCRIMDFG